MSTATLPLTLNLAAYTGATFRRQFRWRPGGAAQPGQDFTGWTGAALIGQRGHAPTVTLTPGNGGLTLTSDGVVTVTVADSATAGLVGCDYYVIDLVNPSGVKTRFLRGQLVVNQDFSS